MRGGVVKKFNHHGMGFEHLLNDPSLHAAAAAMDEPDLTQSGGVRLVEVLFDHRRDVTRRERVQV